MADPANPRPKPDWVDQLADRAIRRHQRTGEPSTPVVVASGISPSGPIHLGNLRELLVPHFVADEIRARGVPCRHLLSWDDYDRLRKVPAGVPESFAEHIGRPLSAVPDPWGEHESWAERFKAPLREALRHLGVEIDEISQTEQYRQGTYRAPIIEALDRRAEIDAVLDEFRTLPTDDGEAPESEAPESEAEVDPAEGAGADYWPYKVYCQACDHDATVITAYGRDGESARLDYRCDRCGHDGSFDLRDENHGKLVWKVDWPMRWAHEGVTFEAGGADHSSPGSSFSVGSRLVEAIFGGLAPEYEAYSFVGTRGVGKLSSSAGAVPTPLDALAVLEAPILRWMYVRKSPRQAITIDLAGGIHGLYDEWDALGRKVAAGEAGGSQLRAYQRARTSQTAGVLDGPSAVVPFRTLASAVAVAAGDPDQTARIIGELTDVAADRVADTEPRLSRARAWLDRFAPPEDRITVQAEPDRARLDALDGVERRWLDLLVERLDDDWSLDGVKDLAYGVPKLEAGLPMDTAPTEELKTAQRSFFKLLYELLIGADTGPRIPTLLLAIGRDDVRRLLDVADE